MQDEIKPVADFSQRFGRIVLFTGLISFGNLRYFDPLTNQFACIFCNSGLYLGYGIGFSFTKWLFRDFLVAKPKKMVVFGSVANSSRLYSERESSSLLCTAFMFVSV